MIQAILFDLDGVLVDSLEAWFKLFNKTLKHFGREEFTWQQFMQKVWGGPIERDAKEFFGTSVEDIKKFYFDNFDYFKENLKPFPNAKETLTKLKNKNLKLGLVTNTPRKQAIKLLEHLNLQSYFDVVVGGDEVEHGKPAPDMILLACKKLKIKPEDSTYVGDSNADMIAGKKAKCFTIGFKTDGDKRIDDLRELEEKIFK